jgi:hypothetical protein
MMSSIRKQAYDNVRNNNSKRRHICTYVAVYVIKCGVTHPSIHRELATSHCCEVISWEAILSLEAEEGDVNM